MAIGASVSALAQSRKYTVRPGARLYPAGVEPATEQAPAPSLPLAPGFELPTARQVVGRGLQLAYDSTAAIRAASLYVGLLVVAVAGPALLLLIVVLPRLADIGLDPTDEPTTAQAEQFLRLGGPLYVAGALALLGIVAVSVDGVLIAAATLASRAAGVPLTLRESLGRARQVFWRYGFAAFVVGLLSNGVAVSVDSLVGLLGWPQSIGSSLAGSFVGTAITAPFGYVLTAIVIGDVNGAAALGGSVRLARARPRLAIVVAVFAFLASSLVTLGLGVALDVVDRVATFVHLNLDPSGAGLVVTVPLVAAALVAIGSLTVTVAAIAAAPQVAAFLGLTHYTGGLDRARLQASAAPEPAATPASTGGVEISTTEPGAATTTWWRQPEIPVARRARWVTIPMLVLIGLEVLVALAGIAQAQGV